MPNIVNFDYFSRNHKVKFTFLLKKTKSNCLWWVFGNSSAPVFSAAPCGAEAGCSRCLLQCFITSQKPGFKRKRSQKLNSKNKAKKKFECCIDIHSLPGSVNLNLHSSFLSWSNFYLLESFELYFIFGIWYYWQRLTALINSWKRVW